MRPRRPTIRDVATMAGVSTGTVSNVLTGRRAVQPATRVRIEQAIASLAYTPDLTARALIARRGRKVQHHGDIVPRLGCIGYVCADHVAHVDVLPHRGDRVMARGIEKKLGGRAANVAVTAAGLGPPWPVAVELLSVLGEETESDWADAVLAERQVTLLPASRVPDARLSRCIILVEPDGRRTILNEPLQVSPAALAEWRGGLAAGKLPALFVQGDQVAALGGELAKPAFREIFSITQLGDGEATAAWLDELAPLFSLVLLSRETAHKLLAGGGGTSDLVERMVAAVRGMSGMVALTLGPEGAVLIQGGEVLARATAPAVEVVDETGAGDTFTGVLVAALLNGETPAAALAAAVCGASAAIAVSGAQEHGLTAKALCPAPQAAV